MLPRMPVAVKYGLGFDCICVRVCTCVCKLDFDTCSHSVTKFLNVTMHNATLDILVVKFGICTGEKVSNTWYTICKVHCPFQDFEKRRVLNKFTEEMHSTDMNARKYSAQLHNRYIP